MKFDLYLFDLDGTLLNLGNTGAYADKILENAHSAAADIQATVDIFEKQVEKYDELPTTIEGISKQTIDGRENVVDLAGRFVQNEKKDIVFNFGKYNISGAFIKFSNSFLLY